MEGIQIDVMDGHFVPNITFGPGVVKSLRKSVSIFLDAHLMIANPQQFLKEFSRSGANRIIVHEEACKDLPAILKTIKKLGVEAGIALNPETPAITLEPVLGLADCVQVMTVNPGFAGQKFMSNQVIKIEELSREVRQRHLSAVIMVDGGIDTTTAPIAVRSGATALVAGSSVYNSTSTVAQNVASLRKSIALSEESISPLSSQK